MTRYHLALDVRGALKQDNKFLRGLMTDDLGRTLTANEVKDELMDALAAGKLFLPIGDCNNFDDQRGCLGHPD